MKIIITFDILFIKSSYNFIVLNLDEKFYIEEHQTASSISNSCVLKISILFGVLRILCQQGIFDSRTHLKQLS